MAIMKELLQQASYYGSSEKTLTLLFLQRLTSYKPRVGMLLGTLLTLYSAAVPAGPHDYIVRASASALHIYLGINICTWQRTISGTV